MQQIMHYNGEFRREEVTSAVGSHASTDGSSDRVERGTNSTPRYTGQAGGSLGAQKIVPSVTGLRFLKP